MSGVDSKMDVNALMGQDRAPEGTTKALALIPGLPGQYWRRAFLACALVGGCHPTATIKFGAIFSEAAAGIDENAYIGPRCHIGWAHVERDVLNAAGVHIPSGGKTHGAECLEIPIREQEGQRTCVRIGAGRWIGSAAIVMANVSQH